MAANCGREGEDSPLSVHTTNCSVQPGALAVTAPCLCSTALCSQRSSDIAETEGQAQGEEPGSASPLKERGRFSHSSRQRLLVRLRRRTLAGSFPACHN